MSEVIAERYQLTERLGRGGMGEVWRARDLILQRDVAVKLVTLAGDDPSVRARFQREAVTMAGISHPNVATIFDAGSSGDRAWLVMELFSGGDLAARLRGQGPLGWDEIRRIGSGVTAGLAAAHAFGVVHRDVKPANIMFDGSTPKVLDFGIARLAEAGDGLTQTAMTIGTAGYLSPEQARGEQVTSASDVYALGCLLFAMATGKPPFTAEHQYAVIHHHISTPPPRLGDLRPDCPADLAALLDRMLAKDPAARPTMPQVASVLGGTAAEATLALGTAPVDQQSTQILAPPAPAVTVTAPRELPVTADEAPEDEPRRRFNPLLIVAALALLGIAVALALLWPREDPPPAPPGQTRAVSTQAPPPATTRSTPATSAPSPTTAQPNPTTAEPTTAAPTTAAPTQVPTSPPAPATTTAPAPPQAPSTEASTQPPAPEPTITQAPEPPAPQKPSDVDESGDEAFAAVTRTINGIADQKLANDLSKQWDKVVRWNDQGKQDKVSEAYNELKDELDEKEQDGALSPAEGDRIRKILDSADDHFRG